MFVYGELVKAQLENSASDPTTTVVGLINYQTTTHKVTFATGSIATALLANDGYCVLGTSATAAQNIRLHRGAIGVLQFVLGSDATAEASLSTSLAQLSFKVEGYATGSLPAAGVEGRLLWDSTLKRMKVDNGTSLVVLSSSSAGTSLIWRSDYSPAPMEDNSVGVPLLDFNQTDSQGVYCLLTVPSDYIAGTQIFLKNGSFATTATTNKIKFKTTTYLLEDAGTVLGTYSNSHASTNAEVTANGAASTVSAIGNVDLTDATGKINGQSVASGDKLLVLLIRDCAGESASAAADARLLRDSFTPSFS